MGGHAGRQKYNLLKMNCFCSVQTVNRSVSAFYDILLSIIMLLNIVHWTFGILCVWNIFGKCGSHSIYFVIINQLRIRMDIWGLLYCVPRWRTVSLSVLFEFASGIIHCILSMGKLDSLPPNSPSMRRCLIPRRRQEQKGDCPEIQFCKTHLNQSYHTN